MDIGPPVEGLIRLRFRVTRNARFEMSRTRGKVGRAQAWRALADGQCEKVDLWKWFSLGPRLAAVIVPPGPPMHLSRAGIRQLLMELCELALSTGAVDDAIRGVGGVRLPLDHALVADLEQAAQLQVEENSWPESASMLWLWALVMMHTVLILMGPRAAEECSIAPCRTALCPLKAACVAGRTCCAN